ADEVALHRQAPPVRFQGEQLQPVDGRESLADLPEEGGVAAGAEVGAGGALPARGLQAQEVVGGPGFPGALEGLDLRAELLLQPAALALPLPAVLGPHA